jgi:two-component system OmpR family response regulator
MTASPHVLVIDRDGDVRKVIVEALRAEGFVVSSASDRQSMREALDGNRVDVAVLDFTVAHDEGGRLHDELKQRGVSLVMISGSLDAMILAEEHHLQLLKKPFRTTELCEAIGAALASGQFGRRSL